MSRLQKKCLIATAGFHLTLVLILVFGSAFFTEKSKPEDTQLLTVIPANLVDAAFNSGVKSAQTPPPAPVPQPPEPQPQPKPTPEPPQPKPVVTPPPTPQPAPTLVEKVEKIFKPEPPKPKPEDIKPVEKPAKPEKPKHEIRVDLTKQVVRNTTKTIDTSAADNAREIKRQRDAKLRAIAQATSAIINNASSATEVEMPGESSVSYANYASVVKSIYERAWRTPNNVDNDNAITRVSVTIGSDGTVISSRILTPSGDASVDASVRQTLDRVTFIAPFPDGSKEKTKTFIINFNLKAKRMFG